MMRTIIVDLDKDWRPLIKIFLTERLKTSDLKVATIENATVDALFVQLEQCHVPHDKIALLKALQALIQNSILPNVLEPSALEEYLVSIIKKSKLLQLTKDAKEHIENILIASVCCNEKQFNYLQIRVSEEVVPRLLLLGNNEQALSSNELELIHYFSSASGIQVIEFYHFNPYSISGLMAEILNNLGIATMRFFGNSTSKDELAAFMLEVANQSNIQSLSFAFPDDQVTQCCIASSIELIKAKPELLTISIKTSNLKLRSTAQELIAVLGRRNHLLYGCGNSGLIREALGNDRKILIECCHIFCKLDAAARLLIDFSKRNEEGYWQNICANLQEIFTYLEKLFEYHNDYFLLIYQSLRQLADALLISSEERRDYYALYAEYIELHDALVTRNETMIDKNANPYPQHFIFNLCLYAQSSQGAMHLRALEGEMIAALQKKVKKAIENIELMEKVVSAPGASRQAKMLLVAVVSLSYRAMQFIPAGELVDKVANKFEKIVVKRIAKKDFLKASCFDVAIFSGLYFYFLNCMAKPDLQIKSANDLVFDAMINLLRDSSNRQLQQRGLTSLNILIAKEGTSETRMKGLEGKGGFVQALSKSMEQLGNGYRVLAKKTGTEQTEEFWRENPYFRLSQRYSEVYGFLEDIGREYVRKKMPMSCSYLRTSSCEMRFISIFFLE